MGSHGISYLIDQIAAIDWDCEFEEHIFFRGQRDNDKLLPSLLRRDLTWAQENSLYCDSWIMGQQDLKGLGNSWEMLCYMQHHGIPTRLLDWSSSLLNAVFFALVDCIDCKRKAHLNSAREATCKKRGNPVIWVLCPEVLHPELHKHDSAAFTVGIDAELPDYQKSFIQTEESNWHFRNGPIFMEIPWSNPRIKQQKGCFTFHESKLLIDEVCPRSVRKIEITEEMRTDLLDELAVLKMSEYDIYPDMINLAKWVKRTNFIG